MESRMPVHKYKSFAPLGFHERTWPDKIIERAPIWCSVDLRDGNQALIEPMNTGKKWEMFKLLAEMGFKEIEVGFPAASQTEYDFLRFLIEGNHVPEDVTIQVLTQAREEQITKTFQSLAGVRRAIVHLYMPVSTLQRRVVFGMTKEEIKNVAVKITGLIRKEAEKLAGSDIQYEYSPESFTGAEVDYAVDICEAVMDAWGPTRERKMIVNLPATVEMSTPNIYADQIEWFCTHVRNKDLITISAHAHNDRGTAVAATELAMMAGAERIEGTLFGNGERTGNADIVTLALNLYTQGIDPRLDFRTIGRIIDIYERSTNIPVHIRHPYAGELVYTAFSGSHQDAISKGMKAREREKNPYWEVPYLPIDPTDVGRTYESIIRINSQSGKGGIAYIMEKEYGIQLPKEMQPEFGKVIQNISDKVGQEITTAAIWAAFENEYLLINKPYELRGCKITENDPGKNAEDAPSEVIVNTAITVDGDKKTISGNGNGPINAFCNALKQGLGLDFKITSYFEHARGKGSDSVAVSYIMIEYDAGGTCWGVGMDTNIDIASFKAIINALNRGTARKA